MPLFTGIPVIQALFNVVRPGTPLPVLFHLSHPVKLGYLIITDEVAVSLEGAAAAVVLMLRIGASASPAVMPTFTTRWNALLKALRVPLIRPVFLTVLEMNHRYIFFDLRRPFADSLFVLNKKSVTCKLIRGLIRYSR